MITKNIKQIVREYFLQNPTVKTRVRVLERGLKLPLPSVIRYLKELEEELLIKSEVISGIKLYSASRTSKIFILEKKLFNLKVLCTCGLVEYLVEKYHNPTIVVFGSYALGEDVESSDIDLYIETPKKELVNVKTFEKQLKRKVQIFCYRNLRAIENMELANSILNGLKINGFLEVFK